MDNAHLIVVKRICEDLNLAGIKIGLIKRLNSSVYYDPVLIASPSQKIVCSRIDLVAPAQATVSHYDPKKQRMGVRFWVNNADLPDGKRVSFDSHNRSLGYRCEYNFTLGGIFVGGNNLRPVFSPAEKEITSTILHCLRYHDPDFANNFGLTP